MQGYDKELVDVGLTVVLVLDVLVLVRVALAVDLDVALAVAVDQTRVHSVRIAPRLW